MVKNTGSRLVYLLARETFLIEDLRTMYPLPNTRTSEDLLKSLIKRRDLSHHRPDVDNSKLRDATCADKTCSAWVPPCHLQQPIIPWTIRPMQMYTLWSNLWEIPLRNVQKEEKINKRLCFPRCKCQTVVTHTHIHVWLLSCNKCIINYFLLRSALLKIMLIVCTFFVNKQRNWNDNN